MRLPGSPWSACLLIAGVSALAAWMQWLLLTDGGKSLENLPAPRVAAEGIVEIEPASVFAGDFTPVFVDARKESEFGRKKIPGAVSLPAMEPWKPEIVEKVFAASRAGRSVIVYCGGGRCDDAHHVAARLSAELAIPNAQVLAGGIQAWEAAGGGTE